MQRHHINQHESYRAPRAVAEGTTDGVGVRHCAKEIALSALGGGISFMVLGVVGNLTRRLTPWPLALHMILAVNSK